MSTTTVTEVANAGEAAAALGHRTYSGTIEEATGEVTEVANAGEAAAALGHRTYSGTIEAAD